MVPSTDSLSSKLNGLLTSLYLLTAAQSANTNTDTQDDIYIAIYSASLMREFTLGHLDESAVSYR